MGRPSIENDIRKRSRMLLYATQKTGEQSARTSHQGGVLREEEGKGFDKLTPTGAVMRICCVSVAPGPTSGRDMGCICSC